MALVASVGGLVVIIVAVLIFFAISRERAEGEAAQQYNLLPRQAVEGRMQALDALLMKYPDTTVAKYARLDYADEFYRSKDYGKAQAEYQQVLAKCGAKDIYGERALLGLANCAVETKDYEKARTLYTQVVEGKGVYAPQANKMLERLKNPPVIPAEVAVPPGLAPTETATPPAGTTGK